MKNKKPTNAGLRINLSAVDADAILCALPLVADARADTPAQTRLNRLNCNSVANKLASGISVFSLNELRVICASIDFALDIIKGTGNEFVSVSHIDTEWRADLSKHLFVYNRLRPVFWSIFDGII